MIHYVEKKKHKIESTVNNVLEMREWLKIKPIQFIENNIVAKYQYQKNTKNPFLFWRQCFFNLVSIRVLILQPNFWFYLFGTIKNNKSSIEKYKNIIITQAKANIYHRLQAGITIILL